MSILSKLEGNRSIDTFNANRKANAQVAMTPEAIETLGAELKAQGRLNVYPNRFNVDKPYSVSMKDGMGSKAVFTNYGAFTDVDVAAAVGSLVSAAKFGVSALVGNFDADVAEASPVFQKWIADERNSEVMTKVAAL